jgi:CubicO group peptidase (beta-lactamase class C family)
MRGRALALGAMGLAALSWLAVAKAQEARQSAAAVPVFSPTGPDAEAYGAVENFPLGTRGTSGQIRYLVGNYSRFDELFSTRPVARAATPWSWRRAPAEVKISYTYYSSRYSLEDYLKRNPATGLLIAKDDTILLERYQYARTDRHRFLSQSMAKTITAMLVGIAVSEAAIKSIDDAAAVYASGLAGTEYGKTSIRHLLHMSSGVEFSETYERGDDISRLVADLFSPAGRSAVASLAQFNTRIARPGARWHYASSETEVLGLVLRAAIGRPVTDYLHEKIWAPIGTEADASWAIDNTGHEITFCCFNAVLRDYARLGRLLAYDGSWNGRQVIPRQWVLDATTVRPSDSYLAPGAFGPYGYGYQVWILPGAARRFVLIGIRGQMIFVDPASKLVMVHTAVRQKPVDPDNAETRALWSAVLQELGK